MARNYDVCHGGGAISAATVESDVSSVVLPDQTGKRAYAIITSLPSNTVNVYLCLHATNDAVVGQGIPLAPGDSYEIGMTNLYQGVIRGIADGVAASADLAIQTGV